MKSSFRAIFSIQILIFIFLVSTLANSQSLGNYSASRTTGITYNSIMSSGNSFAGWRYTGGFSEDDNRSEATDIGFDYWYNGQRYTQFSVSSNGFIDFSSSTDDGGPQPDAYGYWNTRFSDSDVANGTWLALAPFYDDMTTGGGADPLGSSIKYQLSGSAPTRVLIVEWDNMAVYGNATPDINFQVKIYETTGVIEYLYETMNAGSNTFSYTIGINASSISNPATANELLTQQTANTSTFNNTAQNNLSTMPTANSQLTFTPLVPANPGSTLSISSITNTGMTLNWTDWATNEVGYVIYRSTDDVNYFFDSQTIANTLSTNISGLLPSTTYYWHVYAVTEGTLSSSIVGNATTLAPGTITSIRNGRWDQTNRWDCACIPSASDNVIVNHRIRVSNANAASNDLTINTGPNGNGRLRYSGSTARTLTVNGNLVINLGATIDIPASSNVAHILNLRGELINNDIFDINTDANSHAIANFIKNDGNQTISGTGTITDFYIINIDKGQKSNILEVTNSVFSCDPDALAFISGGTFKFSSPSANIFSLFSTVKDIPSNGKIWMNSALSTVNFGSSINLRGELVLDAGTLNIGDAADENLISFGGTLEINGGNMTIAGRYDRNNTESTSKYIQTAGTLTLPTVSSTSISQSPFGMDVIGSSYIVSGGTLIIEQGGGAGLGINTSGVSAGAVSGGTIQIGNASTPAAQTMQVNMIADIYNLSINNTNATARLNTNSITVLNDITLFSGVLDENDLDIDLAGDWLATGGSYLPSALGTVTLIGAAQSITTGASSFNNLVLDGTNSKSFQDNLAVNGDLINNAIFNPVNSGFIVSVGGDWTNNGTFNRNGEIVAFEGSTNQIIGGSSTNDLTNISVNKTGGTLTVASTINLYQSLDILSATVVDLDGAGNSETFTLISNATEDARIGSIASGGSIAGNIVFEKYYAGDGFKRWRHISSAVLNATLADLQNEIPISGNFTGSDNGTGAIPINANPSLYYYDNATGGPTLDDRWVFYPTTTNTELLTTTGTEARGYTIWVRDTGPVTYNLTGPVNQGSIDFNASGSNELWTLMGNPYPSDIDWDAVTGWTKTSIQGNTIHMWDGTQYLTWNGSTGSLGDGFIAKGQAFWIEGSATNVSLAATEEVKSTSSATTHRIFDVENPPVVELSVSASGYTDKTYIQFVDSAKFELDPADASKLKHPIFNLYTSSLDSVDLAINMISGDKCSFDIPVNLSNTWNDNYTFSLAISNDLLEIYTITLEDHFTTKDYPIDNESIEFSFDITDDSLSKVVERFLIRFETQALSQFAITAVQDCDDLSQGSISLESSQRGVEYTLWNEGILLDSLVGTGSGITFLLDSSSSMLGDNLYTVKSTRQSCSDEIEQPVKLKLIQHPQLIYDADNNTLGDIKGQPGQWYNGDNLITDIPKSQIMPNLTAGGVFILEVSSEGCELISDPFLITGVEADLATKVISVYPNPSEDYITLSLGELQQSDLKITITDIDGKVFYIEKVNIPTKTVDIRNYSSGIYILLIESDNKVYRSKFVKY